MNIVKRLRPYLDVFEELGAKVDRLERTGSTHYKIIVTSHGKTRFFVAPFSSSDNRSIKNFRADVRRWVRSVNDT